MWGAIALQIPFLNLPLSNDEGGYLFVAEQWGLDLGEVYGGQWVDRPPLLLVIFKIVSWVGGSESAVRVTAMFFTALAVLAARWVGHSINLTRGAVVAALIATGIGSNYWLDGYELTGEKIGGALVLVSCALTLEAWQGTRSAQLSMLAAFGAGFAASCAFLVKQDFVDAAIFAAVLLLLHVRTHWHLLVTGAAGVVAPLGLTGLWAASPRGPGVGPLWSAVVTFRGKASAVLATTGTTATGERAHDLVVLG